MIVPMDVATEKSAGETNKKKIKNRRKSAGSSLLGDFSVSDKVKLALELPTPSLTSSSHGARGY